MEFFTIRNSKAKVSDLYLHKLCSLISVFLTVNRITNLFVHEVLCARACVCGIEVWQTVLKSLRSALCTFHTCEFAFYNAGVHVFKIPIQFRKEKCHEEKLFDTSPGKRIN